MPDKSEFLKRKPALTLNISGYFGCLDADTFIRYQARRPDGTKIDAKGGTIERLYERFNRLPANRHVIEDAEYFAASIDENNIVRQNRVEGVVFSDEKECFRLTTINGQQVVATADHRFYVGNGKYQRLSDLSVSESVFIHDNQILANGRQPRTEKREHVYVKHHPLARTKIVKDVARGYANEYKVLPRSRAVVEAFMNGMALDVYIERLNRGDIDNLQVLSREVDVHHRNHDTLDDRIENLEVLDAKAHIAHHSSINPRLKYITHAVAIQAIESVGIRRTFDIQMTAPMNNFIADGFVVHNSGKTLQALSFPKCYVISCDPAGLETVRQPRNKPFLDNLAWYEELHVETKEELIRTFKETAKADERESVYGCLAHAKELAAKGEVESLVIDGFTYLCDMKWRQINEYEVQKSSNTGNVDSQSMYRNLGLYLHRFVASDLMTMATRHGLNIILTTHLKRESEEAVQGNANIKNRAKKVMTNSDIAPMIEGGFRNKLSGLVGADIYLEKSLKITGEGQARKSEVVYEAICDLARGLGTVVNAKNRFGLPARLPLTNKSLYHAIMESLAVRAQTATTKAAPASQGTPTVAAKTTTAN